jgi:hypothetical protein
MFDDLTNKINFNFFMKYFMCNKKVFILAKKIEKYI